MVGDHVEASVEVTEVDGDRNRVTLACECKVGDKVVLDGEAKVLAPTKR
jgi:3-hydroxybutyryl-CoA dehydratase